MFLYYVAEPVFSPRVSRCETQKYGYICRFKESCGQSIVKNIGCVGCFSNWLGLMGGYVEDEHDWDEGSNYGAGYVGERSELRDIIGERAELNTEYLLGGEDVRDGEFPSFAQINIVGKGACSGVIVSDYHVLTAGHCVWNSKDGLIDAGNVFVLVGTNKNLVKGRDRFANLEVAKICIHPDGVIERDIAILVLREKLQFNTRIQPACWPYLGGSMRVKGYQSLCYQIGIGIIREHDGIRDGPLKDLVQKLRVYRTIINDNSYGIHYASFKSSGGSGAGCVGDSGGPTLCHHERKKRWYVTGIHSGGDCKSSNSTLYNAVLDRSFARMTWDECPPS